MSSSLARRTISFSPPDIRDEDIAAVVEVLKSGWITTGIVGRRFEAELASYVGTTEVVALNSCTAALELALRVLGIGPGDEVVVPAYTYTATAAVVAHVGAKIVMVDSHPGEYWPSIHQILEAVTERTAAIMTVDLAGVPYDTAGLIEALASVPAHRVSRDGLVGRLKRPVVIVDAAHSLGAVRSGQKAGQIGDLTAFSFHAVKNLTTAEGGALTWRRDLPVDSDTFAASIRRLALHGQTKDALAKSQAGGWEYDILETGFKMNMPDVLAALGLTQLRRIDDLILRRHEIAARYAVGLDDAVSLLPHAGENYRSSAHLCLVDLGDAAQFREEIIGGLVEAGISTNVHYKPLPLLTAYQRLGFSIADYPNAYNQYRRVLSLPLHTLLTDADVDFVSSSLKQALASSEGLLP
jgi:dTDP-4-amino-4,6-dideoxygalactose transaminase